MAGWTMWPSNPFATCSKSEASHLARPARGSNELRGEQLTSLRVYTFAYQSRCLQGKFAGRRRLIACSRYTTQTIPSRTHMAGIQ